MSPQMMRFFTVVGMALAMASMQLKVRAETVVQPSVEPASSVAHAAPS